MSKIISVNAGSSSLKFQLFEMPSEEVLTSGIVEKIGFEDAIFTIKVNGEKIKKVLPIPDHTKAVSMLLEALVEYKIVNSLDEITGAGHRAVHGGEIFKESVPVTEDVVEKFASLNDLAPLHNPAGLVGYNAFKNNLPNCKHVFVFDTAFHSTMPKESYIYALPMKYYDDYKIRRYGFHGTSHKYVSLRCAELMNKNVEDTKIITCHLGNGASITAVDGGKSINTSMGFTPLAGVMMGTRCGDIDPAIVTYIMKKTGATPDEMDDIMNKQSGMLGVSGISSDARDIEDGCKEGNPAALLTAEVYVNRVINVVGGYYAQLGGADAIVFTGGIGENDTNMRKMICDRLSAAFGIQLDEELNGKTRGKEVLLSTAESKVAVWLIPTNEELMIARDTYRLIA
ncbi:acetate kinase [[Clostridium] innocuum]|nr:acetate kinase [Erysipelotrichaceae bacterium]MCR0384187.1 acetate kinase [[Clostridium] innocuum]MCR0414811.1 acetate kinase [[Clostridium] innocuum]MCR0534580.1 acetate kinase [[Clostridium] innocuum]MCR0538361.1 acetate kinase [[Clostridium] innocuum]